MKTMNDTNCKKIFVVDDNTANIKVLNEFLINAGFQVFIAKQPKKGLEKIIKLQPDLILLDVLMPDIDGFTICEELKKREETKDIPVIFITALSDTTNKVRGFEVGAVDYITKPFQYDEVLARIKLHLKLRELSQQLEEKNQRLQAEIERNQVQHHTIDASLNAIALADLEGRLTYVNPAFLEFWGYHQASEVLGQSVLSFWQSPEAAQAVVAHLWKKQKWSGELVGKKQDGTQFQVKLIATLILDTDNKPVCLMASFMDVTVVQETTQALWESKKRLQKIVTNIKHGLIVVDSEGKILFVNPAGEQLLGKSTGELLGLNWGLPMPVEDSAEITIHRANGETAIAEMRFTELPWEHQTGYLISLLDVTERKTAEEHLKKLSMACEQSPASIVITDAKGKIEYVNSKFEELTGYTLKEVLGQNPRVLKSGSTLSEEYKLLWDTITSGQEWHGEFHNKKKNGELFWERASISPIKDKHGTITHFVAVKEDITEQKETAALLLHQAQYDALTDLPNRSLARDRLQQAITQAQQNNTQVAVMFIDLDRFKKVNDTLGHAVGDQLLKLASQRLSGCLRSTDTVARFGGDEFVIIIPNLAPPRSSPAIAHRVLDVMSKSFEIGGEELFLGASIGISLYPNDGREIDDLMKKADTAMYQAKHRGRHQFQFFTVEMNHMSQRRLRLENHLRHALKYNELKGVYQPCFDLRSGKIVGAEALMRWEHEKFGIVGPNEFIPIAEETGLITHLGLWILKQACQQAVQWQQKTNSPLWVAVNVSPRQFRDPNLFDEIMTVLIQTGLSPDCLKLEITEQLLMEDIPGSYKMINQFKSEGIHFSIDDFGTGYSSLKYLKEFSFETLKIDKSFITDVPNDSEVNTLVKTIIAMAHGLHLSVIAEGIEKAEQLNFLLQQGCDYAQGYWFAKPLASEQFHTYLHNKTDN